MRIIVINFIILLAVLLPVLSIAESPKVPYIAPPKLVECKTEQTCDHDPKHLEEFVAGFYNWYINTYGLVSPEGYIDYSKNYTEINRNLEFLLSRKFLDWYRSTPEYDNGEPAIYFCAHDYNPIICRLYIPQELTGIITSNTVNISKKSAQIIVNLPESFIQKGYPPPNPPAIKTPLSQLSVWLEVEKGGWRIARVREWPIQEGGIKDIDY